MGVVNRAERGQRSGGDGGRLGGLRLGASWQTGLWGAVGAQGLLGNEHERLGEHLLVTWCRLQRPTFATIVLADPRRAVMYSVSVFSMPRLTLALPIFLLLFACSEPHYTIGDDRRAAGGGAGNAAGSAADGGAGKGAGGSVDAGDAGQAGQPGEAMCPDACTGGCADGVCEINPLADGSLPACPADLDCTVHCENPATCSGQIRCSQARACRVICSGQDNCGAGILCDSALSCDVECSGTNACSFVECSTTGACNVSCDGSHSCSSDVTCGAGACTVKCLGTLSCAGRRDCQASCACDWQCVEGSACFDQATQCPAGCEMPTGCSNAAPVCLSCQ
jgi:hypothetical protein